MGPWQICHAEVGIPFPSCQTLRTRSGQICPLLRHVFPSMHLNHANHQVGNNLPLRKTTIIEDSVNKIHHNGKTGTTGANGRPPPVTTNPPGHTENQTTLNLQSTSTLPLGQHSLPLTPSRSPPLCGSSLQASNRLLRFRSATSLVQTTASQVRHTRPLPGSVVIAGWPHADLSS